MKYDKKYLKKVTIYTTNTLIGGIKKIKAHLIEFGKMEYAQYKNAPYVKYIRKHKRKSEGFVQGFKPYILIVSGWDTPEPQSSFTNPKLSENGFIIQESRHLAHSDSYKTEFDKLIENENVEIIADMRC